MPEGVSPGWVSALGVCLGGLPRGDLFGVCLSGGVSPEEVYTSTPVDRQTPVKT